MLAFGSLCERRARCQTMAFRCGVIGNHSELRRFMRTVVDVAY